MFIPPVLWYNRIFNTTFTPIMTDDQKLNFAITQNERHSETEAMISLRSTLIRNLDKFSGQSKDDVLAMIARLEAELDALMG